jgi:hypothetical protein
LIVFSMQRNKAWNGTGFSAKPGSLELSSMCFLEQVLSISSGKYIVKVMGTSISGNGLSLLQIFLEGKEILSKTLSFSSRVNTETSFELELFSPGPYKIKISRGRDSIGRVSISLLTLFKTIEKKVFLAPAIQKSEVAEKVFFIIDYDNVKSPSELSALFLNMGNVSNYFFLLKTSESFIEKSNNFNFKLFFEWEDLFDYISLFQFSKATYIDGNMAPEIFTKHNFDLKLIDKVESKQISPSKISGIIF